MSKERLLASWSIGELEQLLRFRGGQLPAVARGAWDEEARDIGGKVAQVGSHPLAVNSPVLFVMREGWAPQDWDAVREDAPAQGGARLGGARRCRADKRWFAG